MLPPEPAGALVDPMANVLARALSGTKAYLPFKAVHQFRGLRLRARTAKLFANSAG
jgi:hypothetical protein